VAAAMAYGLGRGADDEQSAIMVFDLGGGTFDVCLLQSFDGILEVVGSDGDNSLGGVDIDHAIVNALLAKAGGKGVRVQRKSPCCTLIWGDRQLTSQHVPAIVWAEMA
jgi:molecular chaperone DnaK (HSP70)